MDWRRACCVIWLGGVALGACRPELRYRTPSEIGVPAAASERGAVTPNDRGARPQVRGLTDEDIELAIRRTIDGDPSLGAHRVDIAVARGSVTLTGRASSGPTARRLSEIAERTRGVVELESRLEIAVPWVPDAELHAALSALLRADPAVRDSEIDVDVEHGRVTISGEVASKARAAAATALCWSARGVSSVDNRLSLSPSEARGDAAIQNQIERRFAIDAYLHGRPILIKVTGGKVALSGALPSLFLKRRARSLSELLAPLVEDAELRVEGTPPGEGPIVASDEQTTAAVQEALRYDPRLENTRLGVRAHRGTVVLTGNVDSLRQKLSAERSALDTVGVWAVENSLQVRPGFELGDDAIQGRVRDRMRRDAVVGASDIRVEVVNARAILRGDVASREERSQAEIAAANEPALVAVDNRLYVQGVEGERRDDIAIENAIESRLRWDARVDPSRITVAVSNGVALLRGEVASRTVYDATLESAFAGGAREVVTGLRREDVAFAR